MELNQLLVIATVAATALGAAGVISQVSIQRRQRNLQEAEAHLQQADVWASLSADWQLCLLAAIGRRAVWQQGVPATEATAYFEAVDAYRLANIAWLRAQGIDGDVVDQDDWVRAEEAEHRARERLSPYKTAVQRIVTHLAQVSTLILRRHLSIESVYAAMGPQVVRVGDGLHTVLKMGFGHLSSCPAPANMERMLWKTMTAEEVSSRVGWGDFLDVAQGTAERIALLVDLLLMHAVRIGDATIGDSLTGHPAGCLVDRGRLARAWRAARPFGRMRAARIVWNLASTGRSTRRRFPGLQTAWFRNQWNRMRPIAGTRRSMRRRFPCLQTAWFRNQWKRMRDTGVLPFNRWIRLPVDSLRLPVDVAGAMLRARTAPDVRQLDSPAAIEERRRKYEGHALPDQRSIVG